MIEYFRFYGGIFAQGYYEYDIKKRLDEITEDDFLESENISFEI